jgi:hypothetical protein
LLECGNATRLSGKASLQALARQSPRPTPNEQFMQSCKAQHGVCVWKHTGHITSPSGQNLSEPKQDPTGSLQTAPELLHTTDSTSPSMMFGFCHTCNTRSSLYAAAHDGRWMSKAMTTAKLSTLTQHSLSHVCAPVSLPLLTQHMHHTPAATAPYHRFQPAIVLSLYKAH